MNQKLTDQLALSALTYTVRAARFTCSPGSSGGQTKAPILCEARHRTMALGVINHLDHELDLMFTQALIRFFLARAPRRWSHKSQMHTGALCDLHASRALREYALSRNETGLCAGRRGQSAVVQRCAPRSAPALCAPRRGSSRCVPAFSPAARSRPARSRSCTMSTEPSRFLRA